MEEELCLALDAYISPEEEIREKAVGFFTELIQENQEFYKTLFDIFNNSDILNRKKLCLILIKCIIQNNFEAISQNLADFSQLLGSVIQTFEIQDFDLLTAEIIYQIASNYDDFWVDFPDYLFLFKENGNFLRFCIYILTNCYCNKQVYDKYSEVLAEIEQEMMYQGLQCDDVELQIRSTSHITKQLAMSNDESVFAKYQEHFELICELASYSDNLDPNTFCLFWSQFYVLQIKYLHPLYDIAFNLLQTKEFDPNCQLKLLGIIISDFEKINPENLDEIINTYFSILPAIECMEYGTKIFKNLSNVNFIRSYELFERNIMSFLENEELQEIGLNMLNEFVISYIKQINGDISDIIQNTIPIAFKSIECFDLTTEYLINFLTYNKLNNEDTKAIYMFILECFGQERVDCQYQALRIAQKLGPHPIYFEMFIDIFEKIQFESLPIYFSLLVNLHSAENNLTDDKYEQFFNFLIEKLELFVQQVNELYQKLQDDQDNDDRKEENYKALLFRNTCSNLIYLFSIFNPARFSELYENSIQCFTDFLSKDYFIDIIAGIDSFSFDEIKNDFAHIFKIDDKTRSIEILRESYELIFKDPKCTKLQSILIDFESPEFQGIMEFIKDFNNFEKYLCANQQTIKVDDLIDSTNDVLLPLSKFIYKVDNQEILLKFFICLISLFKYTKTSYELFIKVTQMIKRMVKPKQISYNQQNQWYTELCERLIKNVINIILKVMDRYSQSTYIQSFEALTNLMKFFIYSNNDFGHYFLIKYIIPFYNNYGESSIIGLLNLFSKMIDSNYYNQDELNGMMEIINSISQKENIYLDPRPALFNLITKLSSISSDVTSEYFESAIQTFNQVNNDPFMLDTKIACSYFLICSLNQNQEQFKDVIPLIPEILKVFPSKKLINQFFIEMKTFTENSKTSFTKEIFEAFIGAFARYLSYQNNAPSIFEFNPTFNNELLEMFSQFLAFYFQNFQIENMEELLNSFLTNQPIAIQYILSLQQ